MARLRFAWRSLAKAPLLSLTVVLSVGLGIGANTAIFSLFHQILLNALPVERPEELVPGTAIAAGVAGQSAGSAALRVDHLISSTKVRLAGSVGMDLNVLPACNSC